MTGVYLGFTMSKMWEVDPETRAKVGQTDHAISDPSKEIKTV